MIITFDSQRVVVSLQAQDEFTMRELAEVLDKHNLSEFKIEIIGTPYEVKEDTTSLPYYTKDPFTITCTGPNCLNNSSNEPE